MKKVTRKENFEKAIKLAESVGDVELCEFFQHEIEVIENKKANKTKTATQVANEGIKETILNTLSNADKGLSITEIQETTPEFANLSNQKMSALLTQLVKEGKVNKEYDKRKAYFSII